MSRRSRRSSRPVTLLPYTTLGRSYRRQHPWNWESEKEWADAIDRAKLNPAYRFISAMETGNGRGKPEENGFSARLAKLMGFRMTAARSEEHTSELQSLMRISYAVFRLTKKTRYRPNSANRIT